MFTDPKHVHALHASAPTGDDEDQAAIMLLLEEYLDQVEHAADRLRHTERGED